MISVKPCFLKHSISCSSTGLPSIKIIGFGISDATLEMRVPFPPAIITTFIICPPKVNNLLVHNI